MSAQIIRACYVAQPSASGGVWGLDQLGRRESVAPGPTASGVPVLDAHCRRMQVRPCWLGRPLSAVSMS